MKLWKMGIFTVVIGGLINAILIQNHIGGFPREGMRLVILIGIFVFLFGLIQAFRKKS
ncbi:MAG TPA: hypothetical protein PKL97_07720 [Candidatus Omnitrophota bacterium]|nr:hypothetical protein [Candidatus Omnitrophota bacterium]